MFNLYIIFFLRSNVIINTPEILLISKYNQNTNPLYVLEALLGGLILLNKIEEKEEESNLINKNNLYILKSSSSSTSIIFLFNSK